MNFTFYQYKLLQVVYSIYNLLSEYQSKMRKKTILFVI